MAQSRRIGATRRRSRLPSQITLFERTAEFIWVSLSEPHILASHQLKSINLERVFTDDDLIPLPRLLDGLFPSLEVVDKCQTGIESTNVEQLFFLCALYLNFDDAIGPR